MATQNDLGDDDSGRTLFRFEAGPYRDHQFRVASFRGRERTNGLYEFRVEVAAHGVDLMTLETLVLGQPGCLVIGAQGARRAVHGIVTSIDFAGVFTGVDVPRLVLRLSPRAWLLKRTRNSRIFQDMTVRDIVTEVLKQHGVAHQWALGARYRERVYCLQYRESDWAFVTRLLAEEGIFFFFRHPSTALSEMTGGVAGAVGAAASSVGGLVGGDAGQALGTAAAALGASEVLTFGDQPGACPPIDAGEDGNEALTVAIVAAQTAAMAGRAPVAVAPTLTLRDDDGMLPQENYVARFALRRAVREKSVLLRRYEFKQPRLDLRGEASVSPLDGATPALSVGLSGSRLSLGVEIDHTAPIGIPPSQLRFYDHHAEDEDPDYGRTRAQTVLEQLRAEAVLGRGKSWCRRLIPGHRFVLDELGQDALDGAYVVTAVAHEGEAAKMFPDEPNERDRAQTYRNRFECAPATVAARPPRPEMHTRQSLEPARVVGPPNEEIYTDEFGRIKVQFFWDNDGRFNEFSSCWVRVVQHWAGNSWGAQFIPRVGMEVMISFVYGDQDRPVCIGAVYNGENDHPFRVPADRTRSGIRTQSSPGASGYNEISFQDLAGREQLYLRAQRDMDEAVGHDHSVTVAHDERVTVRNDQDVAAERDMTVRVGRNHSLDVKGDRAEVVGSVRTLRVDGNDHVLTQHHAFYTARENYNLQVGRAFNTYVGSDHEPGSTNFWCWGPTQWGSDHAHTFEAREKITLRVGQSVIEMTPDAIRMSSPNVSIDGTEETVIRGKDPQMTLNDTARLVSKEVKVQSKGVTMKLDDAMFRVEAPAHILTSGTGAAADERQKVTGETKPFKLKLTNSQFEPYASRPYELTVGTIRFTGTTSGGGEINEQVPKDATHATVQLWVGDPPTGAVRIMQVDLVDALPPPSGTVGAKMRLAHLGYYQGVLDEEVDGGLREAVRQFQQDHDLEITGEPGDIAGRLEEVHGS